MTVRIGVYDHVNHNKLIIQSSMNATCFAPCRPSSGTRKHDLNISTYAYRCFKICEISQIFTKIYKIVIALNCMYFQVLLYTS